jgi:hypothetical protein
MGCGASAGGGASAPTASGEEAACAEGGLVLHMGGLLAPHHRYSHAALLRTDAM